MHVCSTCTCVLRETQLQKVIEFVERLADQEGAGMLTPQEKVLKVLEELRQPLE